MGGTSLANDSRPLCCCLKSVGSHWVAELEAPRERTSPWYGVFDFDCVSTGVSLELQGRFRRFTVNFDGRWRECGIHEAF